MQDELLERHAALRDDEQPTSLAAGDERLLDRAAACDELLTLGWRDPLGRRRRTPRRVALTGALEAARAAEGREC